jgi:hypothetical protein
MFVLFFVTQIIFSNTALSKEAEVTFIDIENGGLHYAEEIQLACDLLGLKFKMQHIGPTKYLEILKSGKAFHGEGVLILTGRALKYFNEDVFSNLGHRDSKTKILILGINSETDIVDLKMWSGNRIKNFRQFDLPSFTPSMRVVNNDQISMELGGLEYPLIGYGSKMIHGFELVDSFEAVSLVEVVDDSGRPVCPVFLKTDLASKSVFFLTSLEKLFTDKTNKLFKMFPILMFLRHSFGDRCWHGTNDYANLTIDDPWLREPYGYIRFADLCREAKQARFHVTIGFIPFNYNKSQNDALEVFRKCNENLSIAVHGNNHDYSEFRFSRNGGFTDKKNSGIHPDEKNILQALYRMDAFKQKTGLSYDRVMIFPRGAFTKESLGLLKKHNFLMTVNSTRPTNAADVKNDVDRLRGITLEYGNFATVRRHGIPDWKNDKPAVAETIRWTKMRLFLDLPVLLYTHHDFFKDGADEFNIIADLINKVQPETIWPGLGNIGKKLYLQKRNHDGEVEILAYSSNLVIKNRYPVTMKYVVRKEEDFLIPIQSVEVDGFKHDFIQDGNNIKVEVFIEPNCEKNIRILYYSDYQVGTFTYSDTDLQVTLIRTLSDFRDLYLSKLPFGDKMVMIFYWIGGVKGFGIGLLGVTGIILILLVLYKKNNGKKRIMAK